MCPIPIEIGMEMTVCLEKTLSVRKVSRVSEQGNSSQSTSRQTLCISTSGLQISWVWLGPDSHGRFLRVAAVAGYFALLDHLSRPRFQSQTTEIEAASNRAEAANILSVRHMYVRREETY